MIPPVTYGKKGCFWIRANWMRKATTILYTWPHPDQTHLLSLELSFEPSHLLPLQPQLDVEPSHLPLKPRSELGPIQPQPEVKLPVSPPLQPRSEVWSIQPRSDIEPSYLPRPRPDVNQPYLPRR